MAKPIRLTFAASSANAICLSQTLAGAGALALNGAACDTFPTARYRPVGTGFARPITLTSAGNLSGVNFTIVGTDLRGNPQTVVIAGPNATTVATTENFLSVTSITANAAVGSAITVGTGTTGVSQWVIMDYQLTPVSLGLGIAVTGTIDWTVQQTSANVQQSEPSSAEIINHPDTNLVSQTVSRQGSYSYPLGATRLRVNSSSGGSLTFDVYQAGIV